MGLYGIKLCGEFGGVPPGQMTHGPSKVIVLVVLLQRNRSNRICIHMCVCTCNTYARTWEREIYYEELAHVIMEAEKSHNLPSTSWRPRKAWCYNLVWLQRQEKPGEHLVRIPVQGPEKMRLDVPVQSVRQEKRGEFLLPALCSVQALKELGRWLSTLERVIYFTVSSNSVMLISCENMLPDTQMHRLIWLALQG